MVHPYTWLLDCVGDDGIKLTSAGYLPPAHVEAAVAELSLSEEWIGKGNRENQTLPVLHLRESAMAMGLLRKRNGMLLLTSRGRTARTDPSALWQHLAQIMPRPSRDQFETQAGLILLTVIAARAKGDPDVTVARLLSAIGWVNGNGTELDRLAAEPGLLGYPDRAPPTRCPRRRLALRSTNGRRRHLFPGCPATLAHPVSIPPARLYPLPLAREQNGG